MNFELLSWGDGTVRLTYWDNLHGRDVSFILLPDGTAERDSNNENDKAAPVPNLVLALLAELQKREAEQP